MKKLRRLYRKMAQLHRFRIDLTARECREYYQGLFTSIQVHTEQGLRLRLPAHHVRAFMTANGVSGVFELYLDENNKFISLHKISN